MQNILVIQTAFIGDVILATALIEKLHKKHPEAAIYFLVRKGNETLFINHPFLKEVLIWDKKSSKYKNLFLLLKKIRTLKLDLIVDAHRYASSGFLTVFSGAKLKIGYDKNPFSIFFNIKKAHQIGNGIHEVIRNQSLISGITDEVFCKPKLYPSKIDYEYVSKYQNKKYFCIAPSSVWFTKQWPEQNWIELCNKLQESIIYVLGAKSDEILCERILYGSTNKSVVNLAGKLSMLQSAALMQNAQMNFVNDSGPLHFASAVNAPVTAIFCSTVKDFGFYPLSDVSYVAEVKEKIDCRPCGLHGYKECPKGNFKCGNNLKADQVLSIAGI